MRIAIVIVGKTGPAWMTDAVNEYAQRISHFADIEFRLVPAAGNLPSSVALEKEGQGILSKLNPKEKVLLLDEHGKEFTSVQLAEFLDKLAIGGTSSLVFVTGGAYGVSNQVRERADHVISFSKFTFTHQMIRLLLVEQVYRAMTISKGRPYHNE